MVEGVITHTTLELFLFLQVCLFLVTSQVARAFESLVTQVTSVSFEVSVDLDVDIQLSRPRVGLGALWTLERPLTSVRHLVIVQLTLTVERARTLIAGVRARCLVRQDVNVEISNTGETFTTFRANVWFLSSVNSAMCDQLLLELEFFLTVATRETHVLRMDAGLVSVQVLRREKLLGTHIT